MRQKEPGSARGPAPEDAPSPDGQWAGLTAKPAAAPADVSLLDALSRVVEDAPLPCNFEEVFASTAVAQDPLRASLFHFPEDEVELVRHDKHLRTEDTAALEVTASLPLFVQDAMAFYRDPWEVLQRKFEDTAAVAPRLVVDGSKLAPVEYPEAKESKPLAADAKVRACQALSTALLFLTPLPSPPGFPSP